MLNIDCDNNITMYQGDRGFINFRCGNYMLKDGDVVEFEVCEKGIKAVVTEFEEGIATIELYEYQTKCEKGTYDYSIRVITVEGMNEKVIKGKFILQ